VSVLPPNTDGSHSLSVSASARVERRVSHVGISGV
jgi:hypothetical protein